MNFPGTGIAEPLESLYLAGIANELFPLILFIGIIMATTYLIAKLTSKKKDKND